MSWRYTGLDRPDAKVPVLCAWRVNADHPGSLDCYLYGVAVWSGSGCHWHDPEDDENSTVEPMYWQRIEAPDNRCMEPK